MMRAAVVVREAVPSDAEALIRLWQDQAGGQAARLAVPSPGEAARSIARHAMDPHESLQVAEIDGDVVGTAHLSRRPVSPLHEEDAVHLSHLYVHPDHRRRGVGRALLAHAASWAEEKGSSQMLAAVAAGSRDANRFLARLGLAQLAMVRAVPVAVLRQRLAASDSDVDTPARQARRRTLLRRQIIQRGGRRGAVSS